MEKQQVLIENIETKMNYNWRQLDIRLYAVIASLLISGFTILLPDTPNDDAYVYIRTAEIFLSDGFAAAFAHYSWASYSILIALVSTLGFSLFTAAFVINALFYVMLVYAFISIVKEIDDSKLVLVMAAISILVYPQLNEYRYFIIRDIGFWALSIFSLWQFLQYAKHHSLKFATAFCCSLLFAASLRAEAIIYLIATPFALLLDTRYVKQDRRRYFFTLTGIVVAAIVIALVAITVIGIDIRSLFVEFISVYEPFLESTFGASEAELSRLGTALFGEHAAAYSQEYVTLFMATGLLAILLANMFNGIGGPYLWVLIYGFFRKQIRLTRHVAVPVIIYLLVNAIILFGFLYVTRYLTSRYALLFCLLLVIFVPLILARLWQGAKGTGRPRLTASLLALFLAYCAFDSYLSFGISKDYVFDSIEWIADNSDESRGLVTNNHAVAYFSGKVENYDKTLRNLTEYEIFTASPDDLVAIEMHYEMTQLVGSKSIANLLELQIIFPDTGDKRIAIYRRVAP